MIRRKFMKYAPKEHNDEKVKKTLEKHNVPMYEGAPPAKFGQFGNLAKEISAKSRKTFAAPEGGHVAEADKAFGFQQKQLYGGGPQGPVKNDPKNPYTMTQPQGNPYAAGNPYGGGSGNPYANEAGNPYGGDAAARRSERPGAGTAGANPYGSDGDAYGRRGSSHSVNGAPADPRSQRAMPSRAPMGSQRGPQSSQRAPYIAKQAAPAGYDANPYGSPYGDSNASGGNAYGDNAYGDDAYGGNAYGGNAYGDNAYGGGAYGGSAYGGSARGDSSSAYGDINNGAYGDRSNAYGSAYGGKPENANGPLAMPSLVRTETSSSNYSGRAASTLADFDELNQTHTELERAEENSDDDELMHSGASIYQGAGGGRAASIRSGRTAATNFAPDPRPALVEEAEEEDELNMMPSQYDYSHGQGYKTGEELFEDSEDEDVENVKFQMRQVKQESLASTRRALQIAHEAETSGRNTLGMLGDQGERLGNSAKTVAIGRVQARVADANADELQRLNRSIFIPNVANPFNSRRRHQLKEQKLKSERAMDERESEMLDRLQRESERRVVDGLGGADEGYSETAMRIQQRMNRDNPERKMYQFEADSEDEDMEDELAQNLEGIAQASKRLHGLSLRINDEVDAQNERIEEMGGRVEDLDYSLYKSTAKMATIN